MLPDSKPGGEKPMFNHKYERQLPTRVDNTLSAKEIDAPISNGHVAAIREKESLSLKSVRLPPLSSKPPTGHLQVGNKLKLKKLGQLRKASARGLRPKTPQERIMTPDLLSTADFGYILPQFCYDVEMAIEADFKARKKSKRLKTKRRKSARRELPLNTTDAGPE
ncbi:hypothetical protein DPMN_116800 [Dreissena polymorpha]|uniref:Uncharacterized protein n=1 Tax=Dreissena polymorpha TaxID=45954 RepID=A0A9D4QUL3_DREPO|nr:hypothetical protein DPMN_116800 [Dreissena polymorpha]